MSRTSPFGREEESADDTVRRPLQGGAGGSGGVRPPFSEPGSRRLSAAAPDSLLAMPSDFDEAPFAPPAAQRGAFGQQGYASPSQGFGGQGFGAQDFGGQGLGGRDQLGGQGQLGSQGQFGGQERFGGSGPLADLASAVGTGTGRRSRADTLTPTARRADEFIEGVFEAAALNPLVSVASPLLWLAARLHESAAPDDIRLFRDRVVEEMRRFEAAAMARGLSNRSVLVARYALCATLDDIILNTSWAVQAQWAARGLVSLIYGETWGGERFYELLQQLVQSPDENIDALELLAVCLAIGFVGKYRVMEDGQGALNRLRAELYRIIRRVRGSYERDLAPAWRGADVPYRPAPSALRFWAPVLGALLLLAAFYLVLRLSLESRIEIASQRIAAFVPRTPVPVAKPDLPALPKPVVMTQVQRISAVLSREIADRRVEVVGSPATVTIRLPASSFASAAAALPAGEAPMVERIAAALNPEPGPILVTGYTDNVRPQPTSEFKTNLDLSSARAASVAATLKTYLAAPGRVSTAGRGDADPISSNATAEGRARNRRVDIQIPAEATLKAAVPAAAPAAPAAHAAPAAAPVNAGASTAPPTATPAISSSASAAAPAAAFADAPAGAAKRP